MDKKLHAFIHFSYLHAFLLVHGTLKVEKVFGAWCYDDDVSMRMVSFMVSVYVITAPRRFSLLLLLFPYGSHLKIK